MSDTLTAEIPADVKDNSEKVTDYAFMRHRSPLRFYHTPAERDRQLHIARTIPALNRTVYTYEYEAPETGQRCRIDKIVDKHGTVVNLFHTEYFTRVACTDCTHYYAASYIAVTDADGVTHPAAPFCAAHGAVVKKIAKRQRGCSYTESEPLRIGQHD